ncbi:MAG: prolyl oligopeptidase family serine peptidase, partial [Alistipes sp.]|nr:prolyl oligopeptidase family serine peptidase [Alistipes sp.]
MKRLLLSIAAVVCCISASAVDDGRLIDETLMSGDIERSYKIYLPNDMAAHRSLVVVLHGYGGSADPARFDMNRVADRYGFAVCYPQGERDGRGKRCWNVGYPFQEDMTIDDVEFLCDLVGHLQERYGLSPDNTFCTGLSNGGEMCYLLAYTRSDVFRAVAPIAGLTLESMYRTLSATRAVPLMEVQGTAARTSLWEGD